MVPSNEINDLLALAFTTDSGGNVALRFVSAGLAADSVNDTHIDWGTGANQVSAVDMPIEDSGGNFTATDVEAALAELATGGVAGAPTDATYIVQVPNGTLTNEQALSALATGIVKNTTTTGVLSIAVEGTDYYGPGGTDIPVTDGGTGASDAATARTNLGVAIGSDVQAYDATLAALAAYNTNGVIVQTAADTFAGRTIIGTTDRITLTNGDGVLGNPTIDIASTYVGQATITTLGTIATGVWQGTAIAVAYGGTGATDAATARTNLGAAASATTISAGGGLTGGGDLSANRTISLDINGQTADASPDGAVDYVITYDASAGGFKKVLLNNLPSGGGGETNTASNGGTGGIGVFDSKSGVDLIFRNIISDGATIAVTLDAANKEINLETIDSAIDHDSLLNFDASEHFTQASITTVGTITTGVWNGTDIAVADGGTGASTAAGARTNLGVAIGSDVQAYDADLDALAALASNGIIVRTGAGTVSARTITGTTNQISVSNGDGVSGNPVLSTPQDIHTSATPQFARLGLGVAAHASDAINLPAGGNIRENGSLVKRTIILSAAGGWGSTTGGAPDPTKAEFVTNDVDMQLIDFDASTDEYVQWTGVLPDNYDGGTITATFYWTAASGSGDVIWGLQGRCFGDSDAIDQAWGTAQTVTDTLITADDVHITSATSAITLAGTPAGGELCQFRVYRDADAGGDTLAVDARLIAVKLEYSIDSYSH